MKISVIMLTYNRENLVEKAIQSILSQTFEDFEFILVDNGSTDQSGKICDRYAKKDARIQVVHREKGTIGAGRNAGLSLARGDYVAFIDDDDYAQPDMLEFLYGLAGEYGAEIAVCGSTKEVDGAVLPNIVYDECCVMNAEEAVHAYLDRKKYNAAFPTKLIQRRLFEMIPFFNEGSYDDIVVGYRYFAKASRVAAHGIPKYCFYRHTGNNSRAATDGRLLYPEQLEEYFKAFRERTEYLKRELPSITEHAQYSEWSYMLSMYDKIVVHRLTDCQKQLDWIRQELAGHYQEFSESVYLRDFERDWLQKYEIRP